MAGARGQRWELRLMTLSSPSFCLLLPHGAEKRYIYLLEPEEREWIARPRGERAGWTLSGGDSSVTGFTWLSGWPIYLEQNTFRNVSVPAALR